MARRMLLFYDKERTPERWFHLFRNRFLMGLSLSLLGICAALSATAQDPPAGRPLDAKTTRNIELTLRSKLGIPSEYEIHLGTRTPSKTPGFSTLPVSFDLPSHPEHSQKLDFLISDDNRTLERISKWDVSVDPASVIPYAGRPVRGNANAKVVIVNFDDLECPYCAQMHSELFPDTLNHYKDLIKIVYRDEPIEELHPWAMHAAVNANCLAAQSSDAYWSYVDYLHTHGQDITGPDRNVKNSNAMLDKTALQQGTKYNLDAARLNACITKQDEAPIKDEMKVSTALAIESTPTLYVNGEMVTGAVPEEELWRVIDRALQDQGITPPPSQYNQPPKPGQVAAKP